MKQFYRFQRPWLAIAIICLFTAACSSAFFYRHMDWLLIRFVEGFVELNESQKQLVRTDLARVSTELEHDVLPDLQALIERIAEDNQNGRMAANIEQYMHSVESLYKRTATFAAPGITALAISLNSKQKNQLFDEFTRRDKKFQRKYIARGEAHAKQEHMRTLQKNIKKWLGKIDATQQAAVQNYAEQYQVNEQAWLDSRRRWRAELKRLLEEDSDSRSADINNLLRLPKQFWTTDYLTVAEQNRSASVTLTRQLTAQMDADQRSKFAHQLAKNQQKVVDFAQAIATTTAAEQAPKRRSSHYSKAALLPLSSSTDEADSL